MDPETIRLIQIIWASAFGSACLLILGVMFMVTDQQILALATQIREGQRQFELLVTSARYEPTAPRRRLTDTGDFMFIEAEAKRRGMTPQELVRQLAEALDK